MTKIDKSTPIDELSEVLYEEEQRLDPHDDYRSYAVLSDFEKEYYRSCIEAILSHEEALLAALDD